MPMMMPSGQASAFSEWFQGPAGRVLAAAQRAWIDAAMQQRPGMPVLWLAPVLPGDAPAAAPCLLAKPCGDGWEGTLRFGLPLPIVSQSLALVVLQHALDLRTATTQSLLDECQRVLMPQGQLLLFGLNPLSPYRWQWRGCGVQPREPLMWRRDLRRAGLVPDPVSRGIGPVWGPGGRQRDDDGAGLSASYLIRAEKRVHAITPTRPQRRLATVPA